MKIVSATEARNNLADLINQVAYSSQQVLIKKTGKPVAVLVNIKNIKLPLERLKVGSPPSTSAGTIVLSRKINMKMVFAAMKEPYEPKSLLGR
jgi:prevent-host-death family protein